MQQNTNTPMSVGVPNTPKPPSPIKNNNSTQSCVVLTAAASTAAASTASTASGSFTKSEKQTLFGDKIYERVFNILNDDACVSSQYISNKILASQYISNKILDLNEQEIMSIMVDEVKFKSITFFHSSNVILIAKLS